MQFSTIVTDVLDRLGETGTDITTKVKRWINIGQQDIASRADWPFLEASANISEVVSTQTYSLSGVSYQKIYDITRNDPSTTDNYKLVYVDNKDYDELFAENTTSGDPRYYTIWANVLKLDVPSDESGTNSLTIKYYKTLSDLSGDSDTSNIPARYHNLLVLYAYMIGLEETEDANTVAKVRNEYEDGIRKMKADLLSPAKQSDPPSWKTSSKSYSI